MVRESDWIISEAKNGSLFRLLLDSPDRYDEDVNFAEGSNPRIAEHLSELLLSEAESLRSVDAALYLFNSPVLAACFKELRAAGVDVRIFSIPIEGYETRDGMVLSRETRTRYSTSKQAEAERIYADLAADDRSLAVREYTHTYARSEKMVRFSRGRLPYSLHAKTIYFDRHDGSSGMALTSSNMAVRDELKYEIALVVEAPSATMASSRSFFGGLADNLQRPPNREMAAESPASTPRDFVSLYTAPFLRDSNARARAFLRSFGARDGDRMVVCAQHIAGMSLNYPEKFARPDGDYRNSVHLESPLTTLLRCAEHGCQVDFASQTFVDLSGNSRGCRAPLNKSAFQEFYSAVLQSPTCSYRVNERVHAKFIVRGDTVLVTTANFTPTQFIYLEHVDIPGFYTGVHAEANHFVLLNDPAIAGALAEYFDSVSRNPSTVTPSEASDRHHCR